MELDELLSLPASERAKLTTAQYEEILKPYFPLCRPSAMTAVRVEAAKASSHKKDLLARLSKLADKFEKEETP